MTMRPFAELSCGQAVACSLFSSTAGSPLAWLTPAPRKPTLPSMATTTAAFWNLRIASPFFD